MALPAPSSETETKVAQSVLRRNLRVRPGERVTIEAWPHTLRWAVALAREARRLRALPLVLYEDEAAYWDSVEAGEMKTLGTAAAHEWAALSQTDVYIHAWGPGDRVRLNALPPKKRDDLFGYNMDWYSVARKAGVRGARLELGRTYPSLAAAYGVDLETWSDQLVAATLVDPAELKRRASPIAKAVASGKRLHITHTNGTDLTLGLAKRRVNSYTGEPVTGDSKRPFDLLCSLPSGAIRVSLDESVADGTLVGNRPCYYDDGMATHPVFEFSNGKLTHAEFDSGGERFDQPFRKGGTGRDKPGLFGVGLNPELHNTPPLEDGEAGAIIVSVGSNQSLGGKNRSSFFGWAVIAGATLEIDGKPFSLPG